MKQKYWNLSLYRLLACLVILTFHIFYIYINKQLSFEYLLSKPVQGLTALSGFLYAGRVITSKKKFYVNNIVKIVVPALMCLSIFALYNLVFMLITQNYDYLSLWTGQRAFEGRFLMQFDNYYYLGYIILCYLITPFITNKGHLRRIIIASVFILEASLAFFLNIAPIAICYFVGYLIGEKFKNEYVDTSLKYKPYILMQWILLTALTFVLFSLAFFVFKSDVYILSHLSHLLEQLSASAFGIASFFLLIYIFRFLNKFGNIPLFNFTDKWTYPVYLFNQAFMIGGMNVTLYVDNEVFKIIFIILFTLVFASIVTLLNRYLPLEKKLMLK